MARWILSAKLAIRILIAKSWTAVRDGIFKEIPKNGGGTDFPNNLRASPFDDDLSIDIAFCQIHLAGQYL
jgi:hypothetical protein